jgi:hypothetical protein
MSLLATRKPVGATRIYGRLYFREAERGGPERQFQPRWQRKSESPPAHAEPSPGAPS